MTISSLNQPMRWVWRSSSLALFAPYFEMESASLGDASSWHSWVHLDLSFSVAIASPLSSSSTLYLLVLAQHLHLHLLSHHKRAVMDNIIFNLCSQEIQIATARQVEPLGAPFVGIRNCGPKLPWMPPSHISDTLRIGCVTFADLKSITTLSILSSQTHSFHVICHHLRSISCPQDNSTGRSNRHSREMVFTCSAAPLISKDFCPFGQLMLGWIRGLREKRS